MIYTKRADLLEAAAKSIRMQEAEKVEPVCKVYGDVYRIINMIGCSLERDVEFPMPYVEGKPVWVGSELYCGAAKHKIASDIEWRRDGESVISLQWDDPNTGLNGMPIESWSWNPPTPKPEIPEGFTPWNGIGVPPILPSIMVIPYFRDCEYIHGGRAVGMCKWEHSGSGNDIIAYRVINDTIQVSRDKMDKIADLSDQLEKAQNSDEHNFARWQAAKAKLDAIDDLVKQLGEVLKD